MTTLQHPPPRPKTTHLVSQKILVRSREEEEEK